MLGVVSALYDRGTGEILWSRIFPSDALKITVGQAAEFSLGLRNWEKLQSNRKSD